MSLSVEQEALVKRCETCGAVIDEKWSRFCKPCREEELESSMSEGDWYGGKRVYY